MLAKEITIKDNFDLDMIIDSGQCFRARLLENGYYRFVSGKNVLYIKPVREITQSNNYRILTNASWDKFWVEYFDLDRDYGSIARDIKHNDKFMKRAEEYSRGIRILRQDPWETLVSFVISQRKSIPAIKSCVEVLCQKYGDRIEINHHGIQDIQDNFHLFPCPDQLADKDICDCGLGYREGYICGLATNPPDLFALDKLTTNELLDSLMQIKGVGMKVANCVALFAYGRVECAPVDTWIQKIIDHYYAGKNPLPGYGDVAGIMQQYAFYYIQNNKNCL
ncbi:MAG: DNA glycosylase [Coriobacteriia bacterium]|nr:DNA glycosylase [Coriobacteriia bacterium]